MVGLWVVESNFIAVVYFYKWYFEGEGKIVVTVIYNYE